VHAADDADPNAVMIHIMKCLIAEVEGRGVGGSVITITYATVPGEDGMDKGPDTVSDQ
jgi:hypothetical protein